MFNAKNKVNSLSFPKELFKILQRTSLLEYPRGISIQQVLMTLKAALQPAIFMSEWQHHQHRCTHQPLPRLPRTQSRDQSRASSGMVLNPLTSLHCSNYLSIEIIISHLADFNTSQMSSLLRNFSLLLVPNPFPEMQQCTVVKYKN